MAKGAKGERRVNRNEQQVVKSLGAALPVQGLREQVTALEAAMALVLGDPLKKPVHKVRTATRRVEAQLELLGMLKGEDWAVRTALRQSGKVRKLLGEVRQAAGKVRDLDVQSEMVKKAVVGGKVRELHEEADELVKYLEGRRDKAAAALVEELKGHALKLGPKLEKLMELLKPAEGLLVADARLAELTRGWYEAGLEDEASDELLHAIRKRAKLARYIAEGGGEVAARLAATFEELQASGGGWHDALTLRMLAKKRLGKKSALVGMFREREGQALAIYRLRLGRGAAE